MKYSPHSYQQHTAHFIETHPAAAIFLDMGMGKTVSTLTAINTLMFDTFTTHRALIIAPLRVARNTWPEEITKWDHLKHLTYAVATGTPAQRRNAIKQHADITIINRENIPWLIKETGKNWPYDLVVIDELSGFKNPQAKRVKALLKVRPAIKRIIGLTGTPAPNGLMDLWAQFKLLDGGRRLGTNISTYRAMYFTPGRRSGYIVYDWRLRPGADREIHSRIRDITLSMTAVEHLDLPAVTFSTRVVEMEPKQQQLYERFKRDLVADIDGHVIDAGSAAVLSMRLRQLAAGAIYDNDGNTTHIHDAKLKELDEIVSEAQGQPVLVAYDFRHDLQRLEARYPQGQDLRTDEAIDAWKRGELQVGFIQPQSAGHGLNLQSGGHILVWVTTPWSLDLYSQTNARLYRQGQQASHVSIIHLVTKGTIDRNILQALQKKDMTQTALIDAVKADLNLPTVKEYAA